MAWFIPIAVEAVSYAATAISIGVGIGLREEKKEKDSLKAIESGNLLKNKIITKLDSKIPENFAIDVVTINLDIERLNTDHRDRLSKVRPKINNVATIEGPFEEIIIQWKNTINTSFDNFNNIIEHDLTNLRTRIKDEYFVIYKKIVKQKEMRYKRVKDWVRKVNENTLTYLCDAYVNNTAIELNKKIKDKYDACERVLRNSNTNILIRLNDTFLKLKTDFARERIDLIKLLNNI